MPGYEPSFAIYIDVPVNRNLVCFLPGHVTSSPYNPNYIKIHVYLNFANYFTRHFPGQFWSAWANYHASRRLARADTTTTHLLENIVSALEAVVHQLPPSQATPLDEIKQV